MRLNDKQMNMQINVKPSDWPNDRETDYELKITEKSSNIENELKMYNMKVNGGMDREEGERDIHKGWIHNIMFGGGGGGGEREIYTDEW